MNTRKFLNKDLGREVWSENFAERFAALPSDRKQESVQQKEQFVSDVLNFEHESGARFSEHFLAKQMGYVDHTTVRYYKNKLSTV